MLPENEAIAETVLVVLKQHPGTIEDLSERLRVDEGKMRYVVTQMVKKGRVILVDRGRYGHPVRVASAAPPPLPFGEST